MRISFIIALLVVGCGSSSTPSGYVCMGSLEKVAGDTYPGTYAGTHALAMSTSDECSRGVGPTMSLGSTVQLDSFGTALFDGTTDVDGFNAFSSSCFGRTLLNDGESEVRGYPLAATKLLRAAVRAATVDFPR